MTGKTVLFHDLATSTGWAFGEPGGIPLFGSFLVARAGAGVGEFAAGYERRAYDQLTKFKPDCFCFEGAFVGDKTSFDTARKLLGLVVVAEKCAFDCAVPMVRELQHSSISKFFTGSGRWKRAEGKQIIMKVCRALGWTPADHDQADALAGWAMQCHLIEPRARPMRWEGSLLGVAS